MTLKADIIKKIIEREGGYVNDPKDSGGETKYGVTKSVARAFGYRGEMIDLPPELAYQVYAAKYWDAVRADDIQVLSSDVAAEVVDTAVNMGVVRASVFLQRVINVMGPQKVAVDGIVGYVTVSALNMLLMTRGKDVVLKALNCLQGAFYIRLAEKRKKDRRFIFGWLKNRVKL